MKRIIVPIVALVGALSASASRDIVWEGLESSSWGGRNWFVFTGGENWVQGNHAVFTNAVPGSVNVDVDVTAVQVRVEDASVDFSGTGLLDLNGPFSVGTGLTATIAHPITTSGNFKKTGAGTLVVTGSETSENTLSRLNVFDGTLRLSGGKTVLTANDQQARGGAISFHANGGRLIVDNGATVVAGPGFVANSGAEMIVTNAVVDFWNTTEYLHGIYDLYDTSKSENSSLSIRDGGVFLASTYRLGKVTAAKRAAFGEQYGLTTVDKGGELRVFQFNMDGTNSRNDYCGGLDFNGGTLVISNHISSGREMYPMSKAYSGNWTNVLVRLRAGGGTIRLAGLNQYNYFRHPIVGADEPDGGLTIDGSGFFYLDAANEYTGGTHLLGTTFIPLSGDRAFGAVPETPTPNVFFDSSEPTLHFGSTMTLHKNRRVQIATNVTAVVGVAGNKVAHIAGTIRAPGDDGHLGGLKVSKSWSGCLEIGPADGETNKVGFLAVAGHLRHVAGTTLVTSNTASVLIEGGGNYSDWQGVMEVAGGRVMVVRGTYVQVSVGGQLIVTNGTFDCSAQHEVLNGHGNAGRVIVGGTGTLFCNRMRISQETAIVDGAPRSYIHLKTGGTLKLHDFWLETGKSAFYTGSLLLDGGTLVPTRSLTEFLGDHGSETKRSHWEKVFVRACAGGAVFDTDGKDITVQNPILTGAANDGGLVKKGFGTLTLAGENTYNGKTRVDGGRLVFSHANGFPGGDLEVSVRALKDNPRTGALVQVASLSFRSGAKVRVVDADGVTPETFGKKVALVEAVNPIASVPEVVGPVGWGLRLSSDRRTLSFCAERGFCVIVR